MAASAIILNGVTFSTGVKDVQEKNERIGKEHTAANGARRFVYRARKHSWAISWEKITLAMFNQIRTIYALTSTFTYTDENGSNFTVFCGSDALSSSVPTVLQNGDLEYNVTLTIKEA